MALTFQNGLFGNTNSGPQTPFQQKTTGVLANLNANPTSIVDPLGYLKNNPTAINSFGFNPNTSAKNSIISGGLSGSQLNSGPQTQQNQGTTTQQSNYGVGFTRDASGNVYDSSGNPVTYASLPKGANGLPLLNLTTLPLRQNPVVSDVAKTAAETGNINPGTATGSQINDGATNQNASVIQNAIDFYNGITNGTNPLLAQWYGANAQVNANNVGQLQDQQAVLDRGPILTSAANNEIGNIESGMTPTSRARLLQNLLLSQNANLAQSQLQTEEGAAQQLLGLRDNVLSTTTDNYGNITAVIRNPDGSISTKNLGPGGQAQINPFTGLPYNVGTGAGGTMGSSTPAGTNINFGNTSQPSYNVTIPQGTLAAQNNNPGNLKYVGQPGAVQGANGFAQFASPSAGFQALQNQISLDSSKGMTLGQYITKYAPPSENNTAQYIQQASTALGVDPNTPLNKIDPTQLAQFQAQKESGTKVTETQNGTPHPSSGIDYTTVVNSVAPTVANNVRQLPDGSAYIDLTGLDPQTSTVARIQAQALGIKALSSSDASSIQDLSRSLSNLNTVSTAFSQLASGNVAGSFAQNITDPLNELFQTNRGSELTAYTQNRDSLFQQINSLAGSNPRINANELNIAANALPTLNEFNKNTLQTGMAKLALTQNYLENAIRTVIPNYVGAPLQANGQYVVKGTDGQLYTFQDPNAATVFKSSQIK